MTSGSQGPLPHPPSPSLTGVRRKGHLTAWGEDMDGEDYRLGSEHALGWDGLQTI